MCGVAGIVGLPRSESQGRLARSLERLVHRGPDGAGTHCTDSVAIGMRRLAVIDLIGGGQPIYNEARTLAVVCNGEIYNYREELERLRASGHRFQSASDVNVIPHSYEEDGVDAVHRWRGMFAAALWDEGSRRLVLWRDRVGKKPLFYWQCDQVFAFASELPALLALVGEVPPIDSSAVASYLRHGYIPHPGTIYRGIKALDPGSALTFDEHGLTVRRYWRRGTSGSTVILADREAAIESIDACLLEATRLRLRSDLPLGVFLSGGIDSGLVASAAVRSGASNLVAFTLSVGGGPLDEAPDAERTGRHLGLEVERIEMPLAPLPLIEKVATMFGQPFADSSAVPSYAVAKAARRTRTVVLNGDGGDEVFAGYRRYRLGRWAGVGAAVCRLGGPLFGAVGVALASGRRRSARGFVGRALRGFAASPRERFALWTTDLFDIRSMAACFPGLLAEFRADVAGEDLGYDSLRAMLTADYDRLLPDDLLVKMDISTMAVGLEARSPFLDTELADLAWSMPDQWLVSGGRTKPLLRALAERYLPPEIAGAPKRGFEVPVARWLAEDLNEMLREVLLAPGARIRQWADPTGLADLIDGKAPHAGNRPQMIWALLMLELFLRNSQVQMPSEMAG